ncbi:MAG: metal-dependent transcriptional regulator [bacterium]|nr:metal-dependent transcriptional regulator [bacterium]MDD5756725.1 metal-dependent transcriptional regulator [bacterium]
MPTKNQEDYLETIFHLESEERTPTTQEIARHLKISSASVSENLKKLAKDDLVKHSPYKGVTLTPKGRNIALDVVRRHRLAERFLVDKLGLKWEKVHEEAHKIEHGISRVVGNKLYEVLGKPKTCPHGNPLPDAKGHIKEELSYPLDTLQKNDKAKIVKITDEDPKLLCYLATLGLLPKMKIRIEEKAPFDGPIMVKVGEATYALGKKIAESIWVRKYEHE